jgi:hypothetical protein
VDKEEREFATDLDGLFFECLLLSEVGDKYIGDNFLYGEGTKLKLKDFSFGELTGFETDCK